MDLFKLFGEIAIRNDSANSAIDDTTGRAEESESKISSAFKKIGTAVVAGFAVDKIKDFAMSTVNASADVQSEASMFTATFGDMGGVATDMFARVAEGTGILASRLQNEGASAFSMFKGANMDNNEALSQTEKFLQVASDASAYYNISMEEATEKVRGFAKGNFENGDAIGVFTNEAQRNAIAMEKYGVKYSEATEAQKQMMALDIIAHTQELSGVTGQASREAESWNVVTGNLKEGWRQFLAVIGAPVLERLIPVVQNLGGVLTDAGAKVQEFQAWFAQMRDEVANSTAFQSLSEILGIIKDKFVQLMDAFVDTGALGAFKDQIIALKDAVLAIDFMKLVTDIGAFIDKFAPLIAGIAGAYGAFQLYNLYLAIKSGLETIAIVSMYAMETASLALSGAMAFLTSPIGIVVVAIGALIAIGVLLYKNWDEVSAFASSVWTGIKDWISNAITATSEVISNVMTTISTTMSNVWTSISTAVSTAWDFIKSVVQVGLMFIGEIIGLAVEILLIPWTFLWESFGTYITSAWEAIKTVVQNGLNAISTFITNIWNAISSTTSAVWNTISTTIGSVVSAISSVVTSVFNSIKSVVVSIWNAISSATSTVWNAISNVVGSVASAISGAVSTAFNAIKNVVTSIWNSISSVTSAVWNAISGVVSSVVNSISSTISNVFNGIKSTVTNIWDGIKNVITNAINGAKNAVSNAVNGIKSVMNFSWSLPPLKMPHFSVTGSFGLNPPSVPKLGLEWYAKGGIMTNPTVFGMNGNNAMIGGEAGNEAVLPLNANTLGGIGAGIASTMSFSGMTDRLDTLISLFQEMRENMNPNMQIVMDSGALVGEIKNDINVELNRASVMSRRGR